LQQLKLTTTLTTRQPSETEASRFLLQNKSRRPRVEVLRGRPGVRTPGRSANWRHCHVQIHRNNSTSTRQGHNELSFCPWL